MGTHIDRLHGADSLGDLLPGLQHVAAPSRIVPGWATVELDRAESELTGTQAGSAARRNARPDDALLDDPILGARCRLVALDDGTELVLLEPSTEGRLAAALARYGEGHVARFLVTDTDGVARAVAAGFVLSAESAGPLGLERLVLAGPRHGPFLLLVVG